MDVLKILAIVGSGALLFIVAELIRRGRLKEKYSLLWLLSGGVLLIFSSSRDILQYVSHLLGIYYPPSLLFLVAFLFLLLITLHFSVVISGLSEKNKQLAQEVALMRQQIQEPLGNRASTNSVKG
ncbi:MAG TPA: DUF2304 domain-containing protein [Nitrospirota bacterium]|nr:DUF2304 domain-containing protein [Nitrospirota bacterium]